MRCKIADVTFGITHKYKYLAKICEGFIDSGENEPECVISVTQADIDGEKERAQGVVFPEYYLESLAAFRKICDYLLKNKDGILFHGSAVAVDNKAYIFAAPSGTGKSTHAALWKGLLKDKMTYINDDKPIIRVENGECFVYGTPWNGKHNLGSNIKVKLAAICEVRRGTENRIEKVSAKEMLSVVFRQTLVPDALPEMDKYLKIIDTVFKNAELFRLYCNTEPQAAEVSYNAMALRGNKEYD